MKYSKELYAECRRRAEAVTEERYREFLDFIATQPADLMIATSHIAAKRMRREAISPIIVEWTIQHIKEPFIMKILDVRDSDSKTILKEMESIQP